MDCSGGDLAVRDVDDGYDDYDVGDGSVVRQMVETEGVRLIPVMGIPMMSDERWNQLAGEGIKKENMTRELYVDLYNLITDSIGDQEEQIEGYLDKMVTIADNPRCQLFEEAARKASMGHKKRKQLQDILERFESEVEDPT